MPRDAGGNYTLPPNNPVASGTVISSEWANPTMQDLGNEITNSLDRQGRGGMLVPFNNVDGTVLLPGITFTLDPGLGWWRAGTSDMRASAAAEQRVRIYDDGAIPGEQRPFQVHDGLQFHNVLTDNFPSDITFEGNLTLGGELTFTEDGAAAGPARNRVIRSTATLLIVHGGSAGLQFNNVANTVSLLTIADSGNVTFVGLVDLAFNTPLRSRNEADSADEDTVRVTAGDQLRLGSPAHTSTLIAGGTVIVPNSLAVTGVIDATGGVNGNITGNAATADAAVAAGIVTTAAQPAITSVGILTDLTVAGSIISTAGSLQVLGNISGASLFGVINTVAQPLITSVGTLTSLTVSGALAVGAGLTVTTGNLNIDSGAIICAGNITAFSDVRLKDNLLPIGNALDKIAHLVGYTYDKDGERNAGLIANDVKKVLPEAVGEHDGFLTLNDAAVTGLIINGLNECRERLNALA